MSEKSLRIALLGFGRMGRLIEDLAIKQGHQVTAKVSRSNPLQPSALLAADVAIEFSSPKVAENLCLQALSLGIPTVSGSTGWDTSPLKEKVMSQRLPAFLHSTNMSIGVNAVFAANALLARVLAKAQVLDPAFKIQAKISETHHTHKLDQPSGTAITLAEGLIQNLPGYQSWSLEPTVIALPVTSLREGEVIGTHQIKLETPYESISLRHEASSRNGFALGAILAAKFIHDQRPGRVYEMVDALELGPLT